MRRHTLWLALAVLVAPALVQVASAQTSDQSAVDAVVEKHLAAVGGRAVLAKLTSRQATGTVTVGTPNGDLSGPVEISTTAPNKSRALMEIDLSPVGVNQTMTIDQRFDGTTGWTLNALQGDTEITGNQLENLRNNFFPNQLMAYKEAGVTVALQPGEKIGDKDMIVLLATPKTGSAVKILLDATTYLVARTVTMVEAPELGGTIEQVSDMSDYRAVDGVQLAFSTVTSAGPQTVTIKLTKVVHNVALDEAMFKGR